MQLQRWPLRLLVTTLLCTTNVASQTVTVTQSPTTTADFNDQFLSAAKSLLDSVYPMIATLQTITLPTNVIIDGTTYRIPAIVGSTPSAASASSSSSSASSAATSPTPTGTSQSAAAATTSGLDRSPTATVAAQQTTTRSDSGDRRLGIILGVVFGVLGLLLLLLILLLAHRRKKRTGYWLKNEKPPSDGEVDAWRSGQPSWLSSNGHPAYRWTTEPDRYAPIGHSGAGPVAPVAAAAVAGAGAGAAAHHRHHDNEKGIEHPTTTAAEVAGDSPHSRRRHSTSPRSSHRISLGHDFDGREIEPVPDPHRPPTPLMHSMFGGAGPAPTSSTNIRPTSLEKRNSIPRKPVPPQLNTHNIQRDSNPFVSPMDDVGYEEEYATPPTVPTRSPERRHSPHVHYPSGPEMSRFDFGLSPGQLRELREAGNRNSNGFGMNGNGIHGGRGSWSEPRREWSFER